MSRWNAVIFDLDGTLIDSVGGVRRALNLMLSGHGRRELSLPEVQALIGHGATWMLERAFAATGSPASPDELEVARGDYLARYEEAPGAETTIYPAAELALSRLKAQGTRLGICTNKPHGITLRVLDAIGLAPYFDAVFGGDLLPFRKPDPRHLLAVAAALESPLEASVYVGDSEVDVATARRAGLPIIAVGFGYAQGNVAALGADLVIDSFDALPEALSALRGRA